MRTLLLRCSRVGSLWALAVLLPQCASPPPAPMASFPTGPSSPPLQSAPPLLEGPRPVPPAVAAVPIPSPDPGAPAAPPAGSTPVLPAEPSPPKPVEIVVIPEELSPDAPKEEMAGREPLPLETEGSGNREAAVARKRTLDYARAFDRYVQGRLDAAQTKTLVDSCRRRRTDNPFCFSLGRKRQLDARIAARRRIYQPPPVRVYEPMPAVLENGRATNWRDLRRAEVRSIIKGIQTLPPGDLAALAHQALEEPRCPNRVAVAVAATLEDSLPNPALHEIIAQLYEKGARCATRDALDREHYRTRSGLYHFLRGDFATAAETLAKVRPNDAYAGRAPYWLYRSYRAAGDAVKAERALQRLLRIHPFSFHALVAQLSEGNDPGERKLVDKTFMKRKSKRSAVNAFIAQAELLQRLGFADTAALVAEWALEGRWHAEGEVRLYLAALGDAHTRVTQLPALVIARPKLLSRETMELLYPTTYRETMERHASDGVDPFLLLALARKESAFDPNAVSIANAQGLLQLNPDTAKKLVAATPGTDDDNPNLLHPDTNASIAARYVAELLQKLGGKLHLAISAYNAGDMPVQTWVRRNPIDDVVLFIDLIPYRETRDYTAGVLTNYYWYRRLYGGSVPDSFRGILPAVARK